MTKTCALCGKVIPTGDLARYLWPVPGSKRPTEGVDVCQACWPGALAAQVSAGLVIPVQRHDHLHLDDGQGEAER